MNLIAFQLAFAVMPGVFISGFATCSRKPQGATGDRSPVDGNFQVHMEGNPTTYIPGQRYNVSITCANGLKFISFTLVAECENCLGSDQDMSGRFGIIDFAETRFSTLCENMVESTNTNSKTRVDVAWMAPDTPSNGCVFIRAAVLQHRNVWFIDDGFLSKRICPEETDEINSQTPLVNPCCVCDEAKYEIVLERKWSRNTHAKDFPWESWRTSFSELVGASHTLNYSFWEYGSLASRGLQELAEHGFTSTLEDEIKQRINSGSIRTIIKAPSIQRRHNVLGTTLATVRVDPKHHVISLVCKIDPSPDWILGVAGLELCLANCTWIDHKVLNLYPWDVGTDAGATYMAPDQPKVPPDVVRRITSTFPSDHRSPFYDESGAPMKPLAVLHVRKRKLYERECDFEDKASLECATHPWNSWSNCSTNCGPGQQYRLRAYKDPMLAKSYKCQLELKQIKQCTGTICGQSEGGEQLHGGSSGGRFDGPAMAECALTEWSLWSPCSVRCGKGLSTRKRDYVNPYARDKCQRGLQVELEQTRNCIGKDCGGTISLGFNEANELDQLSGEQQYEESTYQMNRPDIFSENRNSYNAQNGGENDNLRAGLEVIKQLDGTADNRNLKPQDYIYGSEKLVGKKNQFYQQESKNQRIFQNNPFNEKEQLEVPLRSSNHNDGILQNPLFGSDDIREQYDEFGRRIVTSKGADSNKYAIVQEYCFRKPLLLHHNCRKYPPLIRNYWFFDADDRSCKIFTADPCDENKNKFRTLRACEGTCLRPPQNHETLEEPLAAWSHQNGNKAFG